MDMTEEELFKVMAAWRYWNWAAHAKPEAVAVASRLNIEIPNPTKDFRGGLDHPVRRLVGTGEGNPTNFAILFGPDWEVGMADVWKKIRIEVLLCPPVGSPNHTVAQSYDMGCPVWRPRGPSAEEVEYLGKVADFKRVMARIQGESQ